MSRSFPSNARSRWSSVARTTFADVLSDDDRVATTAAPAHDQREHGDDDNGKDTEPQAHLLGATAAGDHLAKSPGRSTSGREGRRGGRTLARPDERFPRNAGPLT